MDLKKMFDTEDQNIFIIYLFFLQKFLFNL